MEGRKRGKWKQGVSERKKQKVSEGKKERQKGKRGRKKGTETELAIQEK